MTPESSAHQNFQTTFVAKQFYFPNNNLFNHHQETHLCVFSNQLVLSSYLITAEEDVEQIMDVAIWPVLELSNNQGTKKYSRLYHLHNTNNMVHMYSWTKHNQNKIHNIWIF